MNWIKRILLTVENNKRRKQVQQRITECEKRINKVLSKGFVGSYEYKQVDSLKLRVIELQRDLIELEYKDINEKEYELD